MNATIMGKIILILAFLAILALVSTRVLATPFTITDLGVLTHPITHNS
jgi:hypothetical protein